ncbi:fibronectin-binding protein, partial [Staphylococcus aureus]
MKGVSRHVFVRIVQAIIMKHLVYCFKLDNDEFNLKNKYKKYKPCVTRVYDDLNT